MYIPFVGNSTRNQCVLHIPPEEARVFQTKERAPIMLCIEVFRPDEMSLVINQHKNQKQISKLRRSRRGSKTNSMVDLEQQVEAQWRERQPDNPYISVEAPEELQQSLDGDDMSRSLLGDADRDKPSKAHSSFIISSEPTLVPTPLTGPANQNAPGHFRMHNRLNRKRKKKSTRLIEKQLDSIE